MASTKKMIFGITTTLGLGGLILAGSSPVDISRGPTHAIGIIYDGPIAKDVLKRLDSLSLVDKEGGKAIKIGQRNFRLKLFFAVTPSGRAHFSSDDLKFDDGIFLREDLPIERIVPPFSEFMKIKHATMFYFVSSSTMLPADISSQFYEE